MSQDFQKKVRDALHETGLPATHEQTKKFLKDFWILVENEARGQRLRIGEFGSFYWRTAPARKAHNPRTGEVVNVPAREQFKFKSYVDEKT